MPKRLLIVDPDFTPTSPSMKGVLQSFPELRAAGFEIEAWCWQMDPGVNVDHITKLPVLGARRLKLLQALVFSVMVSCLYLWRYQICDRERPALIYSILPYLPQCDVAHAHFSPWDWETRMRQMGRRTVGDWLESVAYHIYRLWTDAYLALSSARLILVPSKAVAADYRAAAPQRHVEVLPNSYDPARFHPGLRHECRDSMRGELGYEPDHCVFIFVSMGHHRRKGFFLATAALAELRVRQPCVRFLVVGGLPATLTRLQRTLDRVHPDWREWLHFTGMVSSSAPYFAAADGFLYPSWSEALALVEIEAAACGLPLFLTRHHGSEMVLDDGRNGRWLPFEPPLMAAVLEEFVTGSWHPVSTDMHHALDGAAYARAFTHHLTSHA